MEPFWISGDASLEKKYQFFQSWTYMGMFPASTSPLLLHFSVPIPRIGTTSTFPPSPSPSQGAVWPPETPPNIPTCSWELYRSSRSPSSPPPALLLSSLSGRSVIEGVDTHAPDSPGRMGNVGAGGGVLLREGEAAISKRFDLQTITDECRTSLRSANK